VQVQLTEIEFISILPVAEYDRDVYNTIVMKKIIRISPIVLMAIILLLSRGCKKEEPESLTQPVTNLSRAGATLNGAVNPNGLLTMVTFEYGTTTSYDSIVKASQSPISGNNITNVSTEITGLTIGKIYHYRVKAENSHWTVYSSDNEFEYGYPPAVKTLEASNLKSTGVTLNGTVNPGGLLTKVTFEYGTSISYGREVSLDQDLLSGKSTITVSAGITGLTIGTTYHFRVKAENPIDRVYGGDIEFEYGYPPVVTSTEVTNLTSTATTLNAMVNAKGSPTTVTFEYGTTTSYGQEVTLIQNPVTGDGTTLVSADISDLTLCATYHFRVKAENFFNTIYSPDKTFLTKPGSPEATTLEAIQNSCTTVILKGSVQSNCTSFVATFQYGTDIASYDQEIAPDQSSFTADGITEVSSNISGLTPGTTYHFRMKAESSDGISYGSDKTITTGLLSLTTTPVSAITATTAISGGAIIIECPFSSITHRGIEWWRVVHTGIVGGRGPVPPHKIQEGTATGSFTITMTGLSPSAVYYVRAYATNSAGTIYGKTIYFKTSSSGK
jgi:hypothetical protein